MKIVSAKELRLNLGDIVRDIVENSEEYTLVFGRGTKAKKIRFSALSEISKVKNQKEYINELFDLEKRTKENIPKTYEDVDFKEIYNNRY